MGRDLKRRVERLEQAIGKMSLPWLHVMLTGDGPEAGPGDRVVDDWLIADNGLLVTQERVTTDPNDLGKRCPQKLDWARRYFEPLDELMPLIADRTLLKPWPGGA
jgi:hypothetical protein